MRGQVNPARPETLACADCRIGLTDLRAIKREATRVTIAPSGNILGNLAVASSPDNKVSGGVRFRRRLGVAAGQHPPRQTVLNAGIQWMIRLSMRTGCVLFHAGCIGALGLCLR